MGNQEGYPDRALRGKGIEASLAQPTGEVGKQDLGRVSLGIVLEGVSPGFCVPCLLLYLLRFRRHSMHQERAITPELRQDLNNVLVLAELKRGGESGGCETSTSLTPFEDAP